MQEAFQKDEHVTPVMFRVARYPKKYGDGVTAVFIAEPWDEYGHKLTCYEHVGQHGACDMGWVLKITRPATPEEYADLKAELEGIPYGYNLKVYKRQTPQHRATIKAEVERMRRARWQSSKVA